MCRQYCTVDEIKTLIISALPVVEEVAAFFSALEVCIGIIIRDQVGLEVAAMSGKLKAPLGALERQLIRGSHFLRMIYWCERLKILYIYT